MLLLVVEHRLALKVICHGKSDLASTFGPGGRLSIPNPNQSLTLAPRWIEFVLEKCPCTLDQNYCDISIVEGYIPAVYLSPHSLRSNWECKRMKYSKSN